MLTQPTLSYLSTKVWRDITGCKLEEKYGSGLHALVMIIVGRPTANSVDSFIMLNLCIHRINPCSNTHLSRHFHRHFDSADYFPGLIGLPKSS